MIPAATPLKGPFRFLTTTALTVLVATTLYPSELRIAGDNSGGQTGNGESNYYPFFSEIAENVIAIDIGDNVGFFQDADGVTWGLGNTWPGLMGSYTSEENNYVSSVPVQIPESIERFWIDRIWSFYKFPGDSKLYSSGYTSIEIWGEPLIRETPMPVFDLENIVDVKSDWTGLMYLTEDKDLYASGLGFTFGNYIEDYTTPKLIASNVKDMGFASYSAYYLTEDGLLINTSKTNPIATNVAFISSNGTSTNSKIFFIDNDNNLKSIPRDGGGIVTHASLVRKVEAWGGNIVFITLNDELYAFGDNDHGLFGLGDFERRQDPALIISNVRDLALNDRCLWVLTNDNTLLAAGNSEQGMLGIAPTEVIRIPRKLSENAIAASVDNTNSYFIDDQKTLYSLGTNRSGQLGIGSREYHISPQAVASSIKQVSAGNQHVLFIDNSNQLWGAGSNTDRQLTPNNISSYHTPTLVETNIVKAVAGSYISFWLKEDGSLWSTDRDDTSPYKVADDVITFDGLYGASYINSQNELITTDSTFLSSYLPLTSLDDSTTSVTLDTGVIDLSSSSYNISYIKQDKSLWYVGIPPYQNEISTVHIEPQLLDNDVTKVASDRGVIAYLKEDGTFWIATGNTTLLPPSFTEPPNEPVQIWPGAIITDFEISSSNLILFTSTPSPTQIVSIGSDKTDPILPGEAATLTIDTQGAFLSYQWFRGELGDRSQPIEGSISNSASVYPYEESSFWVEVVSDNGSDSIQTTVEVGFPAYAQWALEKGLSGKSGAIEGDADYDGISNLFEFAINTQPSLPNELPVEIDYDEDTKQLTLSLPAIDETHLDATVQIFDSITNEWSDFGSLVTSDTNSTATISLDDSHPLTRVQLKVTEAAIQTP